MAGSSDPRKHHYLPRFLLRRFCAPATADEIYVYQKNSGVRKSNIANVACQRDLYAYTTEDGRNVDVERWLGTVEEGAAAALREIDNPLYSPTEDDLDPLAFFAALMFTRVPSARRLHDETGPISRMILKEAARSPELFRKICLECAGDLALDPEQLEREIERSRELINAGKYDGPDAPGHSLGAMIEIARMTSGHLRERNLIILRADGEDDFITGDLPVVTSSETHQLITTGASFASPDTSIWFPAGSRLCLGWTFQKQAGVAHLGASVVRAINKLVMRCAERFVYSGVRSEAVSKLFDKIGGQVVLGQNAFVPPSTFDEALDRIFGYRKPNDK